MTEIQELLNRINSEHYYLKKTQGNKQYMFAYLDNKLNQFNSFVEGYKETFLKNTSSRIQHLNDIKRRLLDLQASPMQNMHLEIEHLTFEATPLYCNLEIDTKAPEISTREMMHMLRVVERGHIWEDKDTIIHELRQKLNEFSNTLRVTITEHRYILQDKDTIIQSLRQKWNGCSNTPCDPITEFQPPDRNVAVPQLHPMHTPSFQSEEFQDFEQDITQLQHDIARLQKELHQSTQMILRLKNEANTREQDVHCLEENLHALREELEQTRADHERNKNVSVSFFLGTTNILNCNQKDMALQIGNENRMIYLAENVQHNPWESET